jgi:hypothetical protein
MFKQRIIAASIATLAAYQTADAGESRRAQARGLAGPPVPSDYASAGDRRDPSPSLNPGPMDMVFQPAAEAGFVPKYAQVALAGSSEWDEWKSMRDVW